MSRTTKSPATLPKQHSRGAQVLTEKAGLSVHIDIICQRENPESDGADALMPYLARCSPNDQIEARGESPKEAIATAKGIYLHWLGDFADPPDLIRFSAIELSSG